MITDARKQNEEAIALSDKNMKHLINIRQKSKQVLTIITQANEQTTTDS